MIKECYFCREHCEVYALNKTTQADIGWHSMTNTKLHKPSLTETYQERLSI